MSVDLNGIAVFVTAAEMGSFTRAAEKLHLTRSAVGKTIARLEERLSVLLFQRTTRKQSLTVEGVMFYEHCQRALAEIRLAEELLNNGKLEVSGRLRISMPVLFGHRCVAPVLTEFSAEHPLLQLEMSFSDRAVDFIEDRFDLAIRIGSLPDNSTLVARQLGEHRMVFCAAPSYLARCGEPQSLAALREHDAAAYIRAGIAQKWQLIDSEGQLQQIRPKAKLLMDDMQAIADAAVYGIGIVWLPYWLVREQLAKGALREVMAAFLSVSFPIQAVWPYTSRLPLKVRLAVDKLLLQLPARLSLIESVVT
ncbi:LysR family transcriptional regulator [Neisseriaceae bacterium TC5R-5]|nr:LysR family transcriptional regulator [Neisseriaceae bacterium TC5R-5]